MQWDGEKHQLPLSHTTHYKWVSPSQLLHDALADKQVQQLQLLCVPGVHNQHKNEGVGAVNIPMVEVSLFLEHPNQWLSCAGNQSAAKRLLTFVAQDLRLQLLATLLRTPIAERTFFSYSCGHAL